MNELDRAKDDALTFIAEELIKDYLYGFFTVEENDGTYSVDWELKINIEKEEQ